MKATIKILTPLSVALMTLLAACGDESDIIIPDSSKYILFDTPTVTVNSQQSRGMENSLTGAFKVYGYCAPQYINNINQISWENAKADWESKSSQVSPRIFSDQTVDAEGNYSLTGGGLRHWEATHDNYNQEDYKYTFLAHYPSTSVFDMNKKYTGEANIADAVGVPELTFTMPFSGGNTNVERDLTSIPDAMWAAVFDHQKGSGPVRLTFRHLLTAFRFQMNNYTNLTLRVTKLHLEGNFYRSTTLNFKSDNAAQTVNDAETFGGRFALFSGRQDIGAQTGTNDIVGETLMLLAGLNPDRLPNYDYLGNDIKMIIDYELLNPMDGSTVSTYTNVTAAFRPGQLRAGVRYTVNLNVLGNQFVLVFLPDTDNWEGDQDNDIIIN